MTVRMRTRRAGNCEYCGKWVNSKKAYLKHIKADHMAKPRERPPIRVKVEK